MTGRPQRPMPDDFAFYAAIEGRHKLEARFNANGRVIDRWRAELGVRYTRPVSDTPKRTIVVARKRIRARRLPAERIEDLEDFDRSDLEACLGVRRAGVSW